jgi:thiaminase
MSSFTDTLSKEKIQRVLIEDEFMKSVRTGRIPFKAFYKRLTQDYLLDAYYIRFVAQVLANAPRSDFKYLIEALQELEEDLTWLEKLLENKHFSIKNVEMDADYKVFQEWFEQLIKNNRNYFVLKIAMYAYTVCSFEMWKSVKNHYFTDYVNKWASRHIEGNLDDLKEALDKAALNVSENEKEEARKVWDTVVTFETSPSDMTVD